MVSQRPFGFLDEKEIPILTLSGGAVSVELIPVGAAVRAIWVPDRDGRPTDV